MRAETVDEKELGAEMLFARLELRALVGCYARVQG